MPRKIKRRNVKAGACAEVCQCSGLKTNLTCATIQHFNETVANQTVKNSRGSAVLGGCESVQTKFKCCRKVNATYSRTITVAAPNVPGAVRGKRVELGPCRRRRRKYYVCKCSGPESNMTCSTKAYVNETRANKVVSRSRGSAVLGKCVSPSTTFKCCRRVNATHSKTVTVPARDVANTVRENDVTIGPCKGSMNDTAVPNVTNCIGWGDPHMITFDGLHYDCQVEGEVILSKSLTSEMLELQGRFTPWTDHSYVTVTTAVAIKARGQPVIQISLESGGSLLFLVDGVEKPAGSRAGFLATQDGSTVTVTYPELQIGLKVASLGGYLNFDLEMARQALVGESMVGLCGTPNNDPSDDWMSPNGTKVPVGSGTDLLFEPSYRYCSRNWCLTRASESLFTYRAGESFRGFSKCDKAYDSAIENALENPDQCLVDACGSNQQCILDGVALGRAGVDNFKNIEASQRLCFPRTEKSCYFSCADALATTCDSTPGLYEICPDESQPPKTVYCDQETDGGGWMLLYSYRHFSGENRLVNGRKIPLDPVSGYSHFHLNQMSGYNPSAIESVRFYCKTSGHNRVMHFKNAHPVVGSIAYNGTSNANRVSVWNDLQCMVTELPGHSAALPRAAASTFPASNGFLTFPFFLGRSHHWGIAAANFAAPRYECDDFLGDYLPGTLSTNTTHNVWVKVKEKCCAFGYGTFSGSGPRYDVFMTFDKTGARVDYTNLRCGYNISIVPNITTIGRFEFLESLQYGLGFCIDRGTVSMTAGHDSVWTYTYVYPSGERVDEIPLSFNCNRTCGLA
jgi:hypothetical protein